MYSTKWTIFLYRSNPPNCKAVPYSTNNNFINVSLCYALVACLPNLIVTTGQPWLISGFVQLVLILAFIITRACWVSEWVSEWGSEGSRGNLSSSIAQLTNKDSLNPQIDTPLFATNENPLQLYHSPGPKIFAFNLTMHGYFEVIMRAIHHSQSLNYLTSQSRVRVLNGPWRLEATLTSSQASPFWSHLTYVAFQNNLFIERIDTSELSYLCISSICALFYNCAWM